MTTLALGLQSAYELAKAEFPKGTPCPVCKCKINSLAIRNDKVLFYPCGCTFALVRETKGITIFPEGGKKP